MSLPIAAFRAAALALTFAAAEKSAAGIAAFAAALAPSTLTGAAGSLTAACSRALSARSCSIASGHSVPPLRLRFTVVVP